MQDFDSVEGGLTELKFGAYNFPRGGDNLLANIEFTPEEVYYSNGKPMEEVFWLPVAAEMVQCLFSTGGT